MKEAAIFFKAFLQNPMAVGSILPSSPAAAQAMIADIKPHENSIILEIGCGTGAFTSAINQMLPNKNSYLGIELNRDLASFLQQRFPALKIVNGDAREAVKIHQKSNLGKVGFVISGLPFASLPQTANENILGEVDKFMAQGNCEFRAIQYGTAFYLPSATKFRRRMEKHYGKTEVSRIAWRNVPPAYALTWRTV